MTTILDSRTRDFLRRAAGQEGGITVLTGAGISAESGIPTFRGPEGYWSIGSREYHPQEMATWRMFSQRPWEVWKWYLYRRAVCRAAKPNAGHRAVVEMERRFGDRFTLVTQNVDGLHVRAGNTRERTFMIHGDVVLMRCAAECSAETWDIPHSFDGWDKTRDITPEEQSLLACPHCGGMARPHILWFDESYNEHFYRIDSTLEAAARTRLLIVAGTSGATNLPNQVVWVVSRDPKAVILDVNIEPSPFSDAATRSGGAFVRHPSGAALPAILDAMGDTGTD